MNDLARERAQTRNFVAFPLSNFKLLFQSLA